MLICGLHFFHRRNKNIYTRILLLFVSHQFWILLEYAYPLGQSDFSNFTVRHNFMVSPSARSVSATITVCKSIAIFNRDAFNFLHPESLMTCLKLVNMSKRKSVHIFIRQKVPTGNYRQQEINNNKSVKQIYIKIVYQTNSTD